MVGNYDAVFVLAGARQRKIHGLELYRAGLATRLLLSVGRFEIRRFPELAVPYLAGSEAPDLLAAAQPIPPPERHFFVTVEAAGVRFERIAPGRFGTLREIAALAKWCEGRPEVRSLLVVSSGYHLRRVRMCCNALLPKGLRVDYAAAAGEARPGARILLLDLIKLPVYAVVLARMRLQA